MITISKIPDGKNWADAIAQYRSKGMQDKFLRCGGGIPSAVAVAFRTEI